VPALISGIILVYSLDIRKGCLRSSWLCRLPVGRDRAIRRGEFLVLRKMPYVEGARAIGLGNWACVRHILPNILLNSGHCIPGDGSGHDAVGEMGFVGVYVGGGNRIAVEAARAGPIEVVDVVNVPNGERCCGATVVRSKPL